MIGERQAFGDRLRRHRERRGISLASISASTKIAASLFAGLERGDCSRWPAGLYSRAYVRSYAEAVGLNADEAVEEFAALFSGKVQVDGGEAPVVRSRRAAGSLRLSLVEEPAEARMAVLRRAGLAAVDLTVAAALAWGVHALLDPGVWVTLAAGLFFQGAGRAITDEPLVSWAYRRLRTPAHDEKPQTDGDVHVGDAARTTA